VVKAVERDHRSWCPSLDQKRGVSGRDGSPSLTVPPG
jgi:hypothetical protein